MDSVSIMIGWPQLETNCLSPQDNECALMETTLPSQKYSFISFHISLRKYVSRIESNAELG